MRGRHELTHPVASEVDGSFPRIRVREGGAFLVSRQTRPAVRGAGSSRAGGSSGRDRATHDLYLSSYMQTYIERDIRELLRIEKRREFETFVKLCALRTGQVVNYHGLGRDANVSPATDKAHWLSVLEDGFLIKLLRSTPHLPLSRLDHAACTLSVYASQPDHATLDSGWWPALTGQDSHLLGQDSHLLGRIDGLPSCLSIYMASSTTKLCLAKSKTGEALPPSGAGSPRQFLAHP